MMDTSAANAILRVDNSRPFRKHFRHQSVGLCMLSQGAGRGSVRVLGEARDTAITGRKLSGKRDRKRTSHPPRQWRDGVEQRHFAWSRRFCRACRHAWSSIIAVPRPGNPLWSLTRPFRMMRKSCKKKGERLRLLVKTVGDGGADLD